MWQEIIHIYNPCIYAFVYRYHGHFGAMVGWVARRTKPPQDSYDIIQHPFVDGVCSGETGRLVGDSSRITCDDICAGLVFS